MNNFKMNMYQYPDYLMHHGILGQRWGIRRYQNEDGSLTLAGKKRYDSPETTKRSADEKTFGKYGAARIKDRIAAGDTIAAARSKEKARLSSARITTDLASRSLSALGAYGGFKLGGIAATAIMATNPTLGALDTFTINVGVRVAGVILGNAIGSDVGGAVGHHVYGYDIHTLRGY